MIEVEVGSLYFSVEKKGDCVKLVFTDVSRNPILDVVLVIRGSDLSYIHRAIEKIMSDME